MKLLSQINIFDLNHIEKKTIDQQVSDWSKFCLDEGIEGFSEASLSMPSRLTDFQKAQVHEWLNKRSGNMLNLILQGVPGCGKTHYALAWLRAFKKSGSWARYVQSKNIADLGKEKGKKYLADKYGECQILLVDDLGSQKPAEWELDYFFTIFDCRYNKNLPTIVTTNLDREALVNFYLERIISRIPGTWIKFGNNDYRSIEKKKNEKMSIL